MPKVSEERILEFCRNAHRLAELVGTLTDDEAMNGLAVSISLEAQKIGLLLQGMDFPELPEELR